jgi:hypothetical protein
LSFDAVECESRFIADPLFIDVFVNARKHSHYLRAAGVNLDDGDDRFEDINRVSLFEFPGTSFESIREVGQGAYWAEINYIR